MAQSLTTQDKAINQHIPLFFYHIHEVNNEIYGHLVDWKPAWEAQKDYLVVYHFNGREAHYWIGTQDASILWKDALAFAISVHTGKCRILHIDLSEINTKAVGSGQARITKTLAKIEDERKALLETKQLAME